MKKGFGSLLLLGMFAVLADCPFAHAQAVGSITGIVTDSSGAIIPGAKVTATRVETGVAQSTVTTGAGSYTIPSLVVGTYNVVAEAQGFKSGTAENITLDVSQERAVDFKLVVAGVTQQVEVNAAPPLINTTNATLAQIVSTEQVENLPLNGRNIEGLMTMQPGIVNYTGGMGWMSNEVAGNGNRGETSVGTLDGADSSDAEMGTLQFTNFNLDAIAEFKVQQNNYSAQYGQGAGTITQIVSKSGTNQFHGSLFEFVRNSAFDARNFFSLNQTNALTGQEIPGSAVPPFKRNEFGGTFGGPIKKDKTFFFVQYAGLRQRLGEPNNAVVPTEAERTGAVTITDANGQSDDLLVPLNPVAQSVLGRYPLPNNPGGQYGVNTYTYEFSQPTNDDQWSARLDHHFSTKDTFFLRASYDNHILRDTDAWAAILGGSNFSSSNIGDARNYAVGSTHIFSPTLVNNFTFTLNRGIEGVPETPAEYTTTQSCTSDGTLQCWGPDTFETKYVTTVFDPLDTLNWTTGRHSFTFGGEFRREWDNGTGVTGTGPSGQYSFNPGTPLPVAIPSTNGEGDLAVGASSPSGLISLMEGSDYQYQRATTVPGFGPAGAGGGGVWWGLRRWTLAGFAQDDFKVTRRLTLNLGVRYEYSSVPWEVGDRMARPEDQGSLYGTFVVNPDPLWAPDYLAGNFGPRFGIAADLGHKTTFRGGFGIFTNMIPTVYPDQDLVNFPLASENYLLNAPYSLTPFSVALPVLTSTSGQPIAANGNTKTIPKNTPVNLAPYAAILGNLFVDDPSDRMRNGYTMNGNVTLEHEFPGAIAVSAAYVANTGVSLYNQWYPNAYSGAEPQYTPFSNTTPGLGEMQVFYNGGHSTYNALQAQARKISAAHGLQFQANYTWAKGMTDADSVWNTGATNLPNPNCLRCEYAPSAYNIVQRFVANFEYDAPFGRLNAFSILPKRLTNGWEFLGIFQAQTGYPFTIGSPYGTLQYGEGGSNRPFFLQKATENPTERSSPQFFSSAVIGNSNQNGAGTGYFSLPTVISPVNGDQVMPSPGNLGRDTFTGPGWPNLDFSVIKDTHITESKTLQFRAEFFNIFNFATFGGPGTTVGSPGFGSTGYTATAERQIQFGLRFMF